MKLNTRIVLISIVAGVLFFCSCKKEPEPIQYDLTSDELRWLPYEGVGFQPIYMQDETGYIHHLNLMYEETRDYRVPDASGNSATFYERNYVNIHFGRHATGCYLEKDANGLELGIFDKAVDGFVFSNAELNNPDDSMTVRGHTFYNVITAELDSNSLDSAHMWKVYVSKGDGVVGAEYRNGVYYVKQ